ncbi:MAG: VCBS repeat-containing protein [Patescibacteria group bacterium]
MKKEFIGQQCIFFVLCTIFIGGTLFIKSQVVHATQFESIGPSPILFKTDGSQEILPNAERRTYGASVFSGDLIGDGSSFIGFSADSNPGINLYKKVDGVWVSVPSYGTLVPFDYLDGLESRPLGTNATLGHFSNSAVMDLVLGARRDPMNESVPRFDHKVLAPGPSVVARFHYVSGVGFSLVNSFYPFGKDYTSGVNVAAGDVDGDGIDEIIVAKSAGAKPDVAFFKSDGTYMYTLSAYDSTFRGGVNVGTADLNGDGRADLVTVPQSQRIAEVRVFDVSSGNILKSLTVLPNMKNGASLSVSPLALQILVGSSAGKISRVQQYSLQTGALTGTNLQPFQSGYQAGVEVAYVPGTNGDFVATFGSKYLTNGQLLSYNWWFQSKPQGSLNKDGTPTPSLFGTDGTVLAKYPAVPVGASVAVGDADGDGMDEVFFGSPPGQKPVVWVYKANGKYVRTFPVFETKLRTGVTVEFLPISGLKAARVIVTPRDGAPSAVRLYTANGAYTGVSFLAFPVTQTKGVMLTVGHFNGDADYQIVAAARGTSLPIRVFSMSGKLLRQRSIATEQASVIPYFSTITNLPDSNGDGADDLITLANPPQQLVFFSSYSGKTLQTHWDYTRAGDWPIDQPPLYPFPRPAGDTYGPITISQLTGRTKLAVGVAGNAGPIVMVTGSSKADINLFSTYPSTWKGAVTPAALPHGYLGKEAYVVVPGRPMDSAQWNSNLNYLKPSEVSQGQLTKMLRVSGKLAHGTYSASIIIANLRNPKLKITALQPKCNGICGAPMSSYVKAANGFAALNGFDISAQVQKGKPIGFTLQKYGGLAFTNTNEWLSSSTDELFLDNYNSIRTNYFATLTKQSLAAGWSRNGSGCCKGSFIGVRGSDLLMVTYSVTGGAAAQRDYIASLNLIRIVQNDGGSAVAQYYYGRYLAGPGNIIYGALVLSQR